MALGISYNPTPTVTRFMQSDKKVLIVKRLV